MIRALRQDRLLFSDCTALIPILLDVTRLLNRLHDGTLPTGVDRVGIAYIERYGTAARALLSERGYCTVLSEADSQRVFSWLTLKARVTPWQIRLLVAKAVCMGWRTPPARGSMLLNTSHTGMEHARYHHWLASRGIRSAFLVHDLIPMEHAEYCRPGVDRLHRQRMRLTLAHASALIANSHATHDSLKQEATRIGHALPRTAVAHLGTGLRPQPILPRLLERPYFVMLGTIEARKNHWLILHVWKRLVAKLGRAAPSLVIIGRRGWECENVLDMLERCQSIQDFVIERAHCPDQEVQAWLAHARALLFPSFAEGYGLPLAEAMEAGIPVIASDLAAFREISHDIPCYLDPLDGPGWQAAVEEYAQPESAARAGQLERIEHFVAPSWDGHFEAVQALLSTLDHE